MVRSGSIMRGDGYSSSASPMAENTVKSGAPKSMLLGDISRLSSAGKLARMIGHKNLYAPRQPDAENQG